MSQSNVSKEALFNRTLQRCWEIPIYRNKLESEGIERNEWISLHDIHRLPLMTRSDLAEAFQKDAIGGFWKDEIVRIAFTPSSGVGLLPIYLTSNDLVFGKEIMANHLKKAGIQKTDVVQNLFSYVITVAGLLIHEAFETLDAKVIPMGPGNIDQQRMVMRQQRTTVLIGNPSFQLLLANQNDRESIEKTYIKTLFVVGEPFSAIEGYREKLRNAFGGLPRIVDWYGLSEIGFIAGECSRESGLHVFDEFVFVEIIDPQSGKVLPFGEKGELVVTTLLREGMPFLRFRTGDLTVLVEETCECGARFTMPYGVFGRVDNVLKVKGIKVYPSQIGFILASIEGVDPRNYSITLSKKQGRDHLKLEIAGDEKKIQKHFLLEKLHNHLLIGVDELIIKQKLSEGIQVNDQRNTFDSLAMDI